MSPACSHPRGLVRDRLRALLAAFAVVIAAFAFTATAAQAAPVTMSFTDPAGDESNGNPAVDILSGSAVFDSTAGTVTVSLTASAPIGSTEGGFIFFLGQKNGDDCDYQTLQDGSNITLVFAPVPGQIATIWAPMGGGDDADGGGPYNSSLQQDGAKISMTTIDPKGLLKGKSWSCFSAQSLQSGSDNAVDTAIGFVTATTGGSDAGSSGSGSGSGGSGGSGSSSTKSGTTLLPVTAPVTTTDSDRDKDGVADSADKCPTVPGAQKNGCPTMPPALEVRLGAARVAIDKLILRTTATRCPATVTVKVTTKGKSVGSGKVSTSQFGSYCRVYGAVKIKITKKVKAVRVTMRATGLGGLGKSAHR